MPDTLMQKAEPRPVAVPAESSHHSAKRTRDTVQAAAPAVRAPEPEKQKAETSTPIIDNLVPGWQPARFSMQTLIVLAIVVAAMLLLSAGLMVVHRLFHFIKSGGWSKTPVEISELGVAGVFTLKQSQSDQQKTDRVRDTELAAVNERLDATVRNHNALTELVSEMSGVLAELNARIDRPILSQAVVDQSAGSQSNGMEGDDDARREQE
ncbi:hypothetical protein [Longimicrobium terrae]|uniref:Uncharacterized protein n=1 Tax=Longimicrobium terrae TaxID=1639882 RepID=A0A841GXM3_9BACT|nr:hypothetical protein [Longimicrobium terrae]MBB4636103.1 hypothetical protein [Longimicrobium terrae]MBB6070498.1 hypothetical protein [Longimicrobium terrae]NNC29488.1 hypothetical protein [Longimicrobium terrae]